MRRVRHRGGPPRGAGHCCYKDDHFFVGLPLQCADHLTLTTEAVLVIDDGLQFFDLRADLRPGLSAAADSRENSGNRVDGYVWLEIEPTRTVAWDYARIREVADES